MSKHGVVGAHTFEHQPEATFEYFHAYARLPYIPHFFGEVFTTGR